MKTFLAYPTTEQEKALQLFLEDNNISFIKDNDDEPLPQHVLDGIAKGQADIEAGRFITLMSLKSG